MTRTVLASVLIAVVAMVAFGLSVLQPHSLPPVLLWVLAAGSVTVPGVMSWRLGRSANLLAPARGFWRRMSVAIALVGCSMGAEAFGTLGLVPISGSINPAGLALSGLAVVVIIVAMYRLPLNLSRQGDRVRVLLDAGTVVLAAAVFLWHYVTRLQLASEHEVTSVVLWSAATMMLTMVAVFGVMKVVLVGGAHVERASLWLLGVGILVGSVGGAAQGLLADAPQLRAQMLVVPLVVVFATVAAQLQRRAGGQAAGERRARPFSLLPYAAVAAVDLLLLVTTLGPDRSDAGPVAVVAVALTAVVVLRQVSAFRENVRLVARLDHSANHDALTQLPNRVLLGARLRAALGNPHGSRSVAVALLDLDGFKKVNDTLGHGVGDALLVEVGQRLAGSVRVTDVVARLGGDEFVVLFDDVDPAGVDAAVDRMIATLTAPISVGRHELRIGASFGIADGCSGDDPTELLRRADVAMYEAKKQKGSSRVHFTPEMDAEVPALAS